MDHQPKKFKLSPQLQKVLGIQEESRTKIVGALWQYIKSNRLQETDESKYQQNNAAGGMQGAALGAGTGTIGGGTAATGTQSARQIINSNAELLSIFGG